LAIAQADVRSDSNEIRVVLAAAFSVKQIKSCFPDSLQWRQRLHWDRKTKKVMGIEDLMYKVLVLETRPCKNIDLDEARRVLIAALQEQHLQPLPWTPRIRAVQQRMQVMHRHDPGSWPDRSEEWLEQNLEVWLGDQLMGLSSFSALGKVQLEEALWQGLSWDKRQEMNQMLPEHWVLPSGRKVSIDYGSAEPAVKAKLQEFFGCTDSPSVLGGKIKLQLHLLSPAGRPLQITKDLASFWRGSYVEVRKEGRGRYPKHPWPEDPSVALPTAKTKRFLARESQTSDSASGAVQQSAGGGRAKKRR
jgi:ATP-dependent helicase HrpB